MAGHHKPDARDVVRRIRRLFWDRALREEDLSKHTLWVMERVLEYGDLADVRLLIAWMGRREFLERLATARLLSPRTRAFWLHVMEREGKTCTRPFSRDAAASCWLRSNN